MTGEGDHACQPHAVRAHRRRTPVYGIEIIRFLAATSVVVWHFAGKPFLTPDASTLHPLLPFPAPLTLPGVAFSWWGWVGVQVFFVISGAVIAYSADGASARTFMVARVARLWPAMVICAAICSALSIFFWHTQLLSQAARFLGSIVFSPLGPWYSGQIWTLPIEIVFYAAVWCLIALRQVGRLEWLAWALASISALYWLEAAITGHALGNTRYLQLLLVLHGGYFALGIVIAKATTDGITAARLLLALIALSTGTIEIDFRAADELHGAIYIHNALVPCLVWLGATGIIFATMQWRDAIAERLRARGTALRVMGRMTYPLYLVHYQTGAPVFAALYLSGVSLWVSFAVAYIVAAACAFVIATRMEPALHEQVKSRLDTMLKAGGAAIATHWDALGHIRKQD